MGNKLNYEDYHKLDNNILYKKCNSCNEWFVCSEENFYINKTNNQDGLNPYCKSCCKKKAIESQIRNPDKYLASQSKMRLRKETKQSRYVSNQKRKNNGVFKKYIVEHPDKVSEYNKRRQSRNHIISKTEWENCKKYFEYCCAYCGLCLDEHFKNYKGELRHFDFNRDHVIDNGANDLSNCVPSCHMCNSSKWKFELKFWYNEDNPKFSEERLNKILRWINSDYLKYFDTDHKESK
jgi:hypothetical protein